MTACRRCAPSCSRAAARAATWLHLARVQARAAERACVGARAPRQPACHLPSAAVLMYLNRLSDLLFVWSRLCARDSGMPEELWVPRGQRAQGDGAQGDAQ